MNVLTIEEMEAVSGGSIVSILGFIAEAAMTFKTAYDTATWYGADDLGVAMSQGWSYSSEMCGQGDVLLYGN